MSSSPDVLRALDACTREPERMSEAERYAFAQEFRRFAVQRETLAAAEKGESTTHAG